MKIGILTHFDSFQSSYALSVGWHERAKLLEYYDQDFDFLVSTRCPEGLYPHQKSILPIIKTSKPYVERANFYTTYYKELLKDYDAILTADVMYQTKGNHLAYNQAVRWAAPHLKARWYHWIHSGWTYRPNPLPPYPENLRYQFPVPAEKHRYIYLNSWELNDLARKMYATSSANVACVYNPKDPRTFFNLSPLAVKIVNQLRFWEKDIVTIFPHCSSRMDAKGIDGVIRVMAALKRYGHKVALVFANANSRSVQIEIVLKKQWMRERYNLIEDEDYVFTSDMNDLKPLPRTDIADLFRMANVFIFASWRETVGNIFQEAMVSGNLLVLNRMLPCLKEMGGRYAIYFESTFKTPGVQDFITGDLTEANYPDEDDYFDTLAENISERLRYMIPLPERWKFSYNWIWENQFKPLLYG